MILQGKKSLPLHAYQNVFEYFLGGLVTESNQKGGHKVCIIVEKNDEHILHIRHVMPMGIAASLTTGLSWHAAHHYKIIKK